MAEAAAGAAPEGAAAGSGGKKVGLVGMLTFAGALLGGVGASLVVAPRIIARQAPPAHGAADSTADAPAEAHEGGEANDKEKKFVELDNIVVNPAGSQGSRFLMASVAISVADEEAQSRLVAREVELRDKVTGILESMTMAQVSAAGARDTLKSRIAVVAREMLGTKAPVQVFLPQFVVQ